MKELSLLRPVLFSIRGPVACSDLGRGRPVMTLAAEVYREKGKRWCEYGVVAR